MPKFVGNVVVTVLVAIMFLAPDTVFKTLPLSITMFGLMVL